MQFLSILFTLLIGGLLKLAQLAGVRWTYGVAVLLWLVLSGAAATMGMATSGTNDGTCSCCSSGCSFCLGGAAAAGFTFTLSGMSNDGSCTNCSALNATWTLTMNPADHCTYEVNVGSQQPNCTYCVASGHGCTWTIQLKIFSTIVDLIMHCDSACGGGDYTVYSIATSSFNCTGTNTLSRTSTFPCSGWPSTLTLTPI